MERTPFSFRLERVRALRERHEDQAREALAESLGHRLRGEALLDAAVRSAQSARSSRRASAAAEATAADLLASQLWLERTERQRMSAALDLDRRDAELESRRAALADAARERQVLERLKLRHAEAHARDSLRREIAVLDDLAGARHGRREAA